MCRERFPRKPARSILAFLGLACLCPSVRAGNLLRVGPGQPFAEIGAAVASARPGDLILVTPGRYAPFVVDGKGISIAATNGASFDVAQVPDLPEIVIRNVPLGQDVTIHGARIAYRDAGAPAVSVSNNAGSVCFSQLEVTPTGHLALDTTAQAMVEVSHTALFWLMDSSIAWFDAQSRQLDFVAHTLSPRMGNDGVSALQLLDSHGVVQNSRLRGFGSELPYLFGGDGLRLVDEGPDLTDASAWLLQDRIAPAVTTGFVGGKGFNGGHAVHQMRVPFERDLIQACGGKDVDVTLFYAPGAGETQLGGSLGGPYGENNSNGGQPVPGGIDFRPPEHCPDGQRNESSVPTRLVRLGSSLDVRVRTRLDRNFLVIFTGSSRFDLAPRPFVGRALIDPSKVLAWRSGTNPALTTTTISVLVPPQPALIGHPITVQTAFGPIGGRLKNLGQPSHVVLVP